MAKKAATKTVRKLVAFRVDPSIVEGLKRVTERDGMPQSVQVDRALRAWLEEREVQIAERGRATKTAKRKSTGRKQARGK